VSGGEPGAIAGTLAIMAGGDAADIKAAAGVFAALGSVVHVGPSGTGQLAKLANQAIVGITIGAVAEALTLAERGGANPEMVRRAIGGGFAGSAILENHGKRMLEGKFAPGGLVTTQLKDMDNALAEAAALGLDLPLTRQAREVYAALAQSADHRALDHAAYYLWLRDLASA
ncbi:MAG: NAD-binding protein, partial [Pseudomonadota bacterium]